jgi:hypothetical protein
MVADEDTVSLMLDAELVERARTELGPDSEGHRAVVERVWNAYLIGRQPRHDTGPSWALRAGGREAGIRGVGCHEPSARCAVLGRLGARRGERVVQGCGSDLDPLRHREHDLALVAQEPFHIDDRDPDQTPIRIGAKRVAFWACIEIHGAAGSARRR